MFCNGFNPCSFVDFPEHICSVIYFSHCNFNCTYCHNPDLVYGNTEKINLDDVLGKIMSLYPNRIDGVCISGGEPTFRIKELRYILKFLREIKVPVKIDTNGSFPNILKEFDFDYVALDIKTSLKNYDILFENKKMSIVLAETIEVLHESYIGKCEYRTTLAVPYVDMNVFVNMKNDFFKSDIPWYLQKAKYTGNHLGPFSLNDCLESEKIANLLKSKYLGEFKYRY